MTYGKKALSLIAAYIAGYSAVSVLNADFVASCVLSIAIMSAMVYLALQIDTIPALLFACAQMIAMGMTCMILISYLLADEILYSQSAWAYNVTNETFLLLDVALLVLIAGGIGRLDSSI